jgi:hypothetical protein
MGHALGTVFFAYGFIENLVIMSQPFNLVGCLP